MISLKSEPAAWRAQVVLSHEVFCGGTLEESEVPIADMADVPTSEQNKLIWKYIM